MTNNIEEAKNLYNECKKHIGKTYPYDNGLIYEHGKPVAITINHVEIDQVFIGVLVYDQITFEDGYQSEPNSYCICGEGLLQIANKVN